MFKALLIYITSLILTGAIISPVVFDLLDPNKELSLNDDFCEEDPNEGKKEYELKDLFFGLEITNSENSFLDKVYISDSYLIKKSLFQHDVVSPPPEYSN